MLYPAALRPLLGPFGPSTVRGVCLFGLACTPSATSSKADVASPPPQCDASYTFTDLSGEVAYLCIFADDTEYSWNGFGVSVYHEYLDGYIVGPVLDLPHICLADLPICVMEPSSLCVTPPEFWGANDEDYALCRTADRDDLLEAFGADPRDAWYRLASWDIAIVCVE